MVLRLVLLATLLLVSPVWAVDYWVDPDNGDNTDPGSEAEPWKTITYAETQTSSGDRIHLMAGDHVGTINGPAGTVWMGAEDDTVAVLSGVNLTSDSVTVKWVKSTGSIQITSGADRCSLHAMTVRTSGTLFNMAGNADDNTLSFITGSTTGAGSVFTTWCAGINPGHPGSESDFFNNFRVTDCWFYFSGSTGADQNTMTPRHHSSPYWARNRIQSRHTGSETGSMVRWFHNHSGQWIDNHFESYNECVGACTENACDEAGNWTFRDNFLDNTFLRDTIMVWGPSSCGTEFLSSSGSSNQSHISGPADNTWTDCVIVAKNWRSQGALIRDTWTGNQLFSPNFNGYGYGWDGVTWEHNTVITTSGTQAIDMAEDGSTGSTEGLIVRNNIFYAPSTNPSCNENGAVVNFGADIANRSLNLFYQEDATVQQIHQRPSGCEAPGDSSEWGNPRFAGPLDFSSIVTHFAVTRSGTSPAALLEGSVALAETENAPDWPDGYVGAIGYTTPATCSKRTGVDIYASPSGSGCDGESAANPIALETANAIAGPGCTVYLLSGNYEGSIYPLYSGTSDDPIVYMAAQDSEAVVPVVARTARRWSQVQHIKIARPYVRVRGIEARGGIYFSHYADTTSDGSLRSAPTPYGSPDSVVVGAFQDSVSHCNAKYLVFSGADNCYAFQDSIDIGTESDLEAVRFTASDTTAKNTTDGAKASTRNTLAQSWVDADSLSNDETFFLVSNSLNDSLSRVVANFNFGAGDSFTVSNGLKIQRAKDLYVYDCRWNTDKYDMDSTLSKGYETFALGIQDSVVGAMFRRDSIYANSNTSLNGDDDFRVDVLLSSNTAGGLWYQSSGSQQNTWRNCFYKTGGTIRATNMSQGTIDSSVFISRYGFPLFMPGSATGDIRYNTFIGKQRAMEFSAEGNTGSGWGPFDARIFYNIFYADDVDQSYIDSMWVFIGDSLKLVKDTVWTGAVVGAGVGSPQMNFNLFFARNVNSDQQPQAPAIAMGFNTNSVTVKQHGEQWSPGSYPYPSNYRSLWGNPSFTDSLVPFTSDAKWDSIGGVGSKDAVKPLGCTWAVDQRWDSPSYAGARVPGETTNPAQITDLDLFVSFDEDPSLTLTWTAVGDSIDGCQPAFYELAYSFAPDDSLPGIPRPPAITPANFEAYRTGVNRVPAQASGTTQQLEIPPIYIRQSAANRYFIRVVDRFGNYGYSNRSVVWAN